MSISGCRRYGDAADFLFLLLLLVACQEAREPIALDDLAASARSGDSKALGQLIGLLGEQGELTNDRVYALLLELGDARFRLCWLKYPPKIAST